MKIWVDADACPVAIKEILCRAAKRVNIPLTFVANHYIPVPKLPMVRSVQVEQGFDVADNWIVEQAQANDLVVTSDIPLAAELVAKNCHVISSRGEKFTKENVRARLNIRDFMETMRSSGVQTAGPNAMSASDRQMFANALDQALAKRLA